MFVCRLFVMWTFFIVSLFVWHYILRIERVKFALSLSLSLSIALTPRLTWLDDSLPASYSPNKLCFGLVECSIAKAKSSFRPNKKRHRRIFVQTNGGCDVMLFPIVDVRIFLCAVLFLVLFPHSNLFRIVCSFNFNCAYYLNDFWVTWFTLLSISSSYVKRVYGWKYICEERERDSCIFRNVKMKLVAIFQIKYWSMLDVLPLGILRSKSQTVSINEKRFRYQNS